MILPFLFSNQKLFGLMSLILKELFLYGEIIDSKKGLGLKKTCVGIFDLRELL